MRAFDGLRLRQAHAIACAVLLIGGVVAAPDRVSAATSGPWDDLLNLRVGERRAEFEAGGPVDRFVVIASIAWDVAWKNPPAGYRPAEASEEFGRWCDALLGDLAGRAGEALSVGRRYEAAAWYLLRDRLEQIRGGWALHRDTEEARGAFDRLFGLEAGTPTERISAFGDLQRDGSVADSPIKAMEAGAVRYLVYLEMLDRARDASTKGLHATAAARWLIVANVGRWYTDPDPAPMTIADALALRIGANSKPFDRARAELAVLAVKVLPFFDAERPSSEPLLRLFDDGTVLGSAPIAKHFRLHPGDRRRQAALAEALGSERLVLEIDDPIITLERADRDETETVRVTQSRRVENTAQIGAWDAEMQKLVVEINDLQRSVASDRAASTQVTAVHGFVTEKYVGTQGGRSYYTDVKETERLSSIRARLDAAGRADRDSKRLETLYAEYEKLAARRPPDARTETRSWTAPYTRHLQVWKVRASRDMRVVGGGATVDLGATQPLDLTYTRVVADPANGIERIDEWRTEDAIRSDPRFHDDAIPAFARFAFNYLLDERLLAFDKTIERRSFPESEFGTERRWVQILFRDPQQETNEAFKKAFLDAARLFEDAAAGDRGAPPTSLVQAVGERPDRMLGAFELNHRAMREPPGMSLPERELLLSTCTALSPRFTDCWRHLGLTRFLRGDLVGAIATLETTVALQPHVETSLILASMYAQRGDWEATERILAEQLPKAGSWEIGILVEKLRNATSRSPDPARMNALIERVQRR